MRTLVKWDEDEWDRLAEIVFSMRLNNPAATLVSLVQKAIGSFPPERRRKIGTIKEIGPLTRRLVSQADDLKHQAHECQSLRDKLKSVKKEDEILASLTDDEVVRQFGSRVLNLMTTEEILASRDMPEVLESLPVSEVLAEGMRRLVEELTNSPVIREISVAKKPQQISVTPRKQKLPRVIIAGLKPAQMDQISHKVQHIADLRFIDKNLHAGEIPAGGNIYVAWVRFVNHTTTSIMKQLAPPGGFIPHSGGIEKMIEAIQTRILPHIA